MTDRERSLQRQREIHVTLEFNPKVTWIFCLKTLFYTPDCKFTIHHRTGDLAFIRSVGTT